MRFEENVEKIKRENKFNEEKRKYESENEELCYTFEENEEQIKKSSKLLDYTYNLYKFTDYVNKCIKYEDSVCNESYFDSEKNT